MRLKWVLRNQVGNPSHQAIGVSVITNRQARRAGTPDITQAGPEFPARSGGSNEPYAAFFKESRTRRTGWRSVQEIQGEAP